MRRHAVDVFLVLFVLGVLLWVFACKGTPAHADAPPDPNSLRIDGRFSDPQREYNSMVVWYDPVRNVTCYQTIVMPTGTALSCLPGQNPGR